MGRPRRGSRWGARAAGGACVVAAAAGLAVFPFAGPAAAAAPVRAGWWTSASAGGAAAPSATPAGELNVSYAAGNVLSYAALAYPVSAASAGSATLTLLVDSSSSQGTPAVQACPTRSGNWHGGGDQPASAAPGYDCAAHSYSGTVSANGSALTFLLDSGAEVAPGLYSVAIVPQPSDNVPELGGNAPASTTAPFSVDFRTPGGASLTGAGSASVPVAGPGPGYGTGGPPPAGGTAAAGGSGAGGAPSAGAPATSGAGSLPPAGTAGTGVPALGSAPVVAPSAGGGLAPRALAGRAGDAPARTKDVALGLLAAMGLVLAGTGSGGGLRTRLAPGGTPGRGIGRFTRPRTAPPRPLL